MDSMWVFHPGLGYVALFASVFVAGFAWAGGSWLWAWLTRPRSPR